MKLRFVAFLPFILAIHSISALSQNFIDNSYGYLDPQVIYDQGQYFGPKRIAELRDSLDLPTSKEISRLTEQLAQQKNAARSRYFVNKVIPMCGMALLYPAVSAITFVGTYVITKTLSMCTSVQAGGVNIFSPLASGLLLNGAVNMIMADPGLLDAYQHIKGGTPPTDALIDLEADYVAHKHLIPANLQAKAEEMLFSTRLGGTSASTTQSYISTLVALQKAQTRSCQISKSWEQIEADISKALSRSPAETREQILNLAYTFYRNASADSTALSRLVAYFNGVPGVGKSRAAEFVARAFGVPVVSLKMPGQTSLTLWGSKGYDPGLIVSSIAALGCSTGFFILEDVDHALAADRSDNLAANLLHLFDTTQTSFFSDFIGAQVDTSKIFMIATGNSKFGKEALADRTNLVNFEDYSPATKEAIVFEEYLPKRLADLAFKAEDFASQEKGLKAAIAADKNTGLREIFRIVDKTLAAYGRTKEKLVTAAKPEKVALAE